MFSGANILPNGIALNASFPILKHGYHNFCVPDSTTKLSPHPQSSISEHLNDFDNESISKIDNSLQKDVPMHGFENSFLQRSILQSLETETQVLVHSALTLTTYYLRSTCLKSFRSFNLQNLDEFKCLRHRLRKLSAKYYVLAINNLRSLLHNLNETNTVLAIIASSILKQVSIYEYDEMNNSLIFSRGLATLYNGLLKEAIQNKDASGINRDVAYVITLVVHASKTKYYEPYNPTLVNEYYEMLLEFKSVLKKMTQDDEHVIFHFNHLMNYTLNLMQLLKERDVRDINMDPQTIYKLLRPLIMILPLETHTMDDISLILMGTVANLYRCLTNILDNLFPRVKLYFLQSFAGGLEIMHNHRRVTKFKLLLENINDQIKNYPGLEDEGSTLKTINIYCIRVNAFMTSRQNSYLVYYDNAQIVNRATPNPTKGEFPSIPAVALKLSLNEVTILKFNTTPIDYINFLHFPAGIKLERYSDTWRHLLSSRGSQMYDYNLHHYEHFVESLSRHATFDPMLSFHLENTQLMSSDGSGQQDHEMSSDQCNEQGQKTYDDDSVLLYVDFFTGSVNTSIDIGLTASYQYRFSDMFQEEAELTMRMNPASGLLFDDRDPLALDKDGQMTEVYTRWLMNMGNSTITWLKNFEEFRNEDLTDAMNSEAFSSINRMDMHTAASPNLMDGDGSALYEESEDCNFYNDLDDKFFILQ